MKFKYCCIYSMRKKYFFSKIFITYNQVSFFDIFEIDIDILGVDVLWPPFRSSLRSLKPGESLSIISKNK